MAKMFNTRSIFAVALCVITFRCDSFLDIVPKGELSESSIVTTEAGVEGVLIGVYSMLHGQYNEITDAYRCGPSNWTFGDVCSGDAYKGSSGISDGADIHLMETFAADGTILSSLRKWEACYEGVSRANRAINVINSFEGWTDEKKQQRIGEARLLRGHFYFELKKIFNRIQYVDETMSPVQLRATSNLDLTSDDVWQKIEEDFIFAASVLPSTQDQIGRLTSGAANGYLTKAYIFQQQWDKAIAAADKVIASSIYKLIEDYQEVFLQHLDANGKDYCAECLFDVQHSLDQGLQSYTTDVGATYGWDGNVGDRLSGLGGPYPRVYGFLRPSQNLVNAFKTDANGLPLLDTFNNSDLNELEAVDPRLDHTVGRPGIPFLDAGIYDESWTRGVSTYGPYSPKKKLYLLHSDQFMNVPYYSSNENFCVMRYADLLLMKAEALIELGKLDEARDIVNTIRRRAKTGKYVLKDDGQPAANYKIEEYVSWPDVDYARKALKMERRLELATEGQRFFDLVRWGVAANVLNEYIRVERTKRTYLFNSVFQKDKHEYFPIPDSEITISEERIKQNPGY